MSQANRDVARSIGRAIDASPSPYHAAMEASAQLAASGYSKLDELEAWDLSPGKWFVVRAGCIVAWSVPEEARAHTPFRVIGAHTDSPNLRVKPRPDHGGSGWGQLGVEVYGGVLLNSWLDRDLGLSGRVQLRGDEGPAARLFRIDRPVLRVPQLAIHLHREIHEDGLRLNKQKHMAPVWGVGGGDARGFRELLAAELDVAPGDVMAWDAMTHDLTPSTIAGWDEEFLFAPRLDNLFSCHCAIQALLAADERGGPLVRVVSLFDHEEVGSGSRAGAGGPVLRTLLERSVLGRGGSREDYHRAIAGSVCVSADMAHGTHPNYTEKHDPDHQLALNAGPVIKVNANQRYATEGETEAFFQHACEVAQVPFQKWVNRTDLACGSTIGPLTAANLGMATVDVGSAQLSMHSAREMCGSDDADYMVRAMTESLLR